MLRCMAGEQACGRELEAGGVVVDARSREGLPGALGSWGGSVSHKGQDACSVAHKASPEQSPAHGWRVANRNARQQKSPHQRQGLGGAMGQTTQASSGAGSFDATTQLATEAEGGASAQDGQGAWSLANKLKVVKISSS